jgi:hypothetical protein
MNLALTYKKARKIYDNLRFTIIDNTKKMLGLFLGEMELEKACLAADISGKHR